MAEWLEHVITTQGDADSNPARYGYICLFEHQIVDREFRRYNISIYWLIALVTKTAFQIKHYNIKILREHSR